MPLAPRPAGRALMLQGTGSDVGKSVLVAGLCRVARRRGLRVAPFKPQNMSNNAAACPGGGEIGRAQALQARAAGIDPSIDLNPVLLKPQSDRRSQIVLHGKALAAADAAVYMARRERLLPEVLRSFATLAGRYDLVLVEGAGSPAETNLRAGDIANMGFARAADVPVCLIGDIDKGGVIASLAGTRAVLDRADAAMIEAFVINKFRGDPALFGGGVRAIEAHTGWPCLGVIPWLAAAAYLPQEDAVALGHAAAGPVEGKIRIAAPMLSRIANFDDADPLSQEPGVRFDWIPPGQAIPRDCDVIILFGSKSTLADLGFLREQGWHHDIIAHARTGGRVLGLCGGYQMLGRRIIDADGVDGAPGSAAGLGLLDTETRMAGDKTVRLAAGCCPLSGQNIQGYEIHMGATVGADCVRPMAIIDGVPDGARSADGRIEGSYLHGLFADNGYRHAWLDRVRHGTASDHDYDGAVDGALEAVANALEEAVDVDALFGLARQPRPTALG